MESTHEPGDSHRQEDAPLDEPSEPRRALCADQEEGVVDHEGVERVVRCAEGGLTWGHGEGCGQAGEEGGIPLEGRWEVGDALGLVLEPCFVR